MISRGTVNPANKNGKRLCGREGVVVRATPRVVLTRDPFQGEKQSATSQVASTQLFMPVLLTSIDKLGRILSGKIPGWIVHIGAENVCNKRVYLKKKIKRQPT